MLLMKEIITIKGFTRNFLIEIDTGKDEKKKSYLLVDTQLKTKYKKFLRKLKKLKIEISQIKYLFITHHHSDHVGFVAKLRGLNDDLRLIVHQEAVEYLKRGEMENYTQPVNFIVKVLMKIVYNMIPLEYCPIKIIPSFDEIIDTEESDFLRENLGIQATILHTPGTTHDNLSIVFDKGEKAIVGDIAINIFKIFGLKHKTPGIVSESQIKESWRKLRDRGVKTIITSHGRPFSIEKLEVD